MMKTTCAELIFLYIVGVPGRCSGFGFRLARGSEVAQNKGYIPLLPDSSRKSLAQIESTYASRMCVLHREGVGRYSTAKTLRAQFNL